MGNSSLACFINKDNVFSNMDNKENPKSDLVPLLIDNLLHQSLIYEELVIPLELLILQIQRLMFP